MPNLPNDDYRAWKRDDMSGYVARMRSPEGLAIYRRVARQVVDDTGVREGLALDLGGGHGGLAEAIAGITGLRFVVCDPNRGELEALAARRAVDPAAARLTPLGGRAEAIPLADATVDLVASRGSLMFWEDPERAAREVARVLKPGGQAYLGGGMGRGLDETEGRRLRERLFGAGGGPPPRARDPELGPRFSGIFGAIETVDYQWIKDGGTWFHVTKRNRALP